MGIRNIYTQIINNIDDSNLYFIIQFNHEKKIIIIPVNNLNLH